MKFQMITTKKILDLHKFGWFYINEQSWSIGLSIFNAKLWKFLQVDHREWTFLWESSRMANCVKYMKSVLLPIYQQNSGSHYPFYANCTGSDNFFKLHKFFFLYLIVAYFGYLVMFEFVELVMLMS